VRNAQVLDLLFGSIEVESGTAAKQRQNSSRTTAEKTKKALEKQAKQ
jgi:hypothetical protein